VAFGEQPGRRRRRTRIRIRPVYVLFSALLAGATLIGAVYATQGASCPKALAPAADAQALANAPLLTGTTATTGQATHYVLTSGGGNCSYPGPPADGLFVALSPGEYASGAACGEYLDVTGSGGTVRVKVIDQCPECAAGHIDLSETAFARLAPLVKGIVPITYRRVLNPTPPGPLSLRVKEGSSAYWLALLVMDHGNALTRVRVSSGGGAWHDLTRASYNYWIFASGLGSGPFTVAITDDQGHTATVGGVKLEPGVVQPSTVYMYGAGSGTGSAAIEPTRAVTPSHVAAASPSASPSPSATPSTTSAAVARSSDGASDTASGASAVTSRSAGCR
jgi:expansin (peptidoglycan-binding protein)